MKISFTLLWVAVLAGCHSNADAFLQAGPQQISTTCGIPFVGTNENSSTSSPRSVSVAPRFVANFRYKNNPNGNNVLLDSMERLGQTLQEHVRSKQPRRKTTTLHDLGQRWSQSLQDTFKKVAKSTRRSQDQSQDLLPMEQWTQMVQDAVTKDKRHTEPTFQLWQDLESLTHTWQDKTNYKPSKNLVEKQLAALVPAKQQTDDFWQQAGPVVWDTAKSVAQGAAWLATHDDSPAAPLRTAASAWMVEQSQQARKSLVAHGKETRAHVVDKIKSTDWKKSLDFKAALDKAPKKVGQPFKIPSSADNALGTELLTKIKTATTDAKVVIDEDILEIQRVAQELKLEVDSQIAAFRNKEDDDKITRRDPKMVRRELYRARRKAVENKRKASSSYVPKPLREAQKKRKNVVADSSSDSAVKKETTDSDAMHQELWRRRLERQFEEPNPPPNHDDDDENMRQKNHVVRPPMPKRTDQEMFQRALLHTRLELESKERQRQAMHDTMHKEREVATVRGQEGQNGLDSKHLFLNELQNGNVDRQNKQDDKSPPPFWAAETNNSTEQVNTVESKEHQLFQLVNASLGLTAPMDLLKDDVEMKKREVESVQIASEEYQEQQARIHDEKEEIRKLMMTVQRNNMEKMKRAKQAREEGTLPVIVAALGQDNAKREMAKFDRSKSHDSESSASSVSKEESESEEACFEQLNRRIRMKYEQEKERQQRAFKSQQATFVVNKFERKSKGVLARVAARLFKRSLKPFGFVATALLQLYISCVHGAGVKANVPLTSPNTVLKDSKTQPQIIPGWRELVAAA